MLIVLVAFYAGLLLFFISGPSMDDVDNLRKVAFVVLLLAVVASGMLIFFGSRMFSIGSVEEPLAEAATPALDEEAVLLEEYLGLSDEAAAKEAEDELEDEDTEEGHA